MPGPSTVAEYLEAVPNAARPLFEELRSTVRAELPDATEVVSYRILGLRQGKRVPSGTRPSPTTAACSRTRRHCSPRWARS